jgi:hypothetical protein
MITASFVANPSGRNRNRASKIRIGGEGSQAGEGHKTTIWLMTADAERLHAELGAAIKKAKAAEVSGLPAQPGAPDAPQTDAA